MKGGLKANGFTIIETLIVLAISGSMLVAVVAMISGQQGKTQFQQSINQVSQQIQQIIGDVSNGYYPVSNITCSASGSSVSIIPSNGSSSLGTNSDCVLVGKVIQFYQTQASVPQQFTVYSMVGSRTGNGAYPIALAPGANTYTNVPPGNTTVTSLANGLSLAYTTYTDSNGVTQTNTVAFGILTSPVSGSGATDTSGAQQINIYAVQGTSASADTNSNVDVIDKQPTNFVQITSYSVCLTSGTTNQSGLITIGGGSRKVSVVLTIKDGKRC